MRIKVSGNNNYRCGNFYPNHELIGTIQPGEYTVQTDKYGQYIRADVECKLSNSSNTEGQIYNVRIPLDRVPCVTMIA